jgi:hypothetical protein
MINNICIFNNIDNIIKLKKLLIDSNNLNNLGFKVNVGNIVWN